LDTAVRFFAATGIPLSFISQGIAGREKHKYREIIFAGKHCVRILRKQWQKMKILLVALRPEKY